MPKAQLLRLVRDAEGRLWPDPWAQAPGRGLYHCASAACVRKTAKALRALRARLGLEAVQPEVLAQRIQQALDAAIEMQLQRLRPQAAVGRDAVLRRLWQHSGAVVLLAEDAGEALRRQIARACDRKQQAGEQAALVQAPGGDWLAAHFEREKLAVVAFDARAAERLIWWLSWRRGWKTNEERSA